MLIDTTGHIRLADFGSCLKIGPDGYVSSFQDTFSFKVMNQPDAIHQIDHLNRTAYCL